MCLPKPLWIRACSFTRVPLPHSRKGSTYVSSLATVTANPSTQILRSCRSVTREASSLLYRDNIFQFELPATCNNTFGYLGRIPFDLVARMSGRQLEIQCSKLFQFSEELWPSQCPTVLWDSAFAYFLRKIGPTNAASVRSIEIGLHRCDPYCHDYCTCTLAAVKSLTIVIELLRQHAGSLRNVEVVFLTSGEPKLCSIYEDREHLDSLILAALEYLIQQVTWLRYLRTCFDLSDGPVGEAAAKLSEIVKLRNHSMGKSEQTHL